MPKNKNLFQDMVRVKKGNSALPTTSSAPLSKIPPISKKTEEPKIKTKPISPKITQPVYEEEENYTDYKKTKSGGKFGFWVLAILCIVGLFFAVSFVFGKIIVNVEPDTQAISLNDTLTATKDSTSQDLSYDLVSLQGEESKIIPGGEEKDVQASATGKVTVYNSYSTAPQNLNVDTRLVATDGRIYKTDKKIIIPAMKKDGTPGSAEVGIYAEKPGVEYNSESLELKIVGFKGTAKFNKIFAISKGEITGGFVGTRREVSDLDKQSASLELKNRIREKLIKKASEQIPEGTILFKDANSFVETQSPLEESVDQGLKITVKGSFYGVLIKEEGLIKKIAEKQIDNYEGAPIYIPQIRDLKFAFKDENLNLAEAKQIEFSLAGNIVVVYKVDENAFKQALLGRKKTIFAETLQSFPSIRSANLNAKPFWLQSFPNDEKKIVINVNYPK